MRRVIILILVVLVSSCTSLKINANSSDGALSTRWVNQAVEYKANCRIVYAAASRKLEELNNKEDTPSNGAIVMDIDETVLDNSPFNMKKTGSGFDKKGWDEWVKEANAKLVPGFMMFYLKLREINLIRKSCEKKEWPLIFVSNREDAFFRETDINLKRHEISYNEMLLKDAVSPTTFEKWTENKCGRFREIRKKHKILMRIGDDLGDFLKIRYDGTNLLNPKEREKLFFENLDKWGSEFFCLPNPVYGSWEKSLNGGS